MRIQVRHRKEGHVFAPDAFDGVIGQHILINYPGQPVAGRLVAAEVVEAGRDVLLTLEIADPSGHTCEGPK